MATKARLQAKLAARKAANNSSTPDGKPTATAEQQQKEKTPFTERPMPPPGAPDLRPEEWADSHRLAVIAYDRDAVVRLGASVELYNALLLSTFEGDGDDCDANKPPKLVDGPQYALSVPMKHSKLEVHNSRRTYLSPKGVVRMVPAQHIAVMVDAEQQVMVKSDATHAELPIGAQEDAFAVSIRVYAREKQPCGFKCNIDGATKAHAIAVPHRTDRNKADRATTIRVADGEDDYRTREQRNTVVPVRAAVMCASRFAPHLLYSLHHIDERHPELKTRGFSVFQPGAALCRASLVYPACVGTPFENVPLVVLSDLHMFSSAMLVDPNWCSLHEFYSHVWGSFEVIERQDKTLAVEHLCERAMYIVTLERYNQLADWTRKVANYNRQEHVALGELWLRGENKPVTLTAIVTYVQLLGCKSLITHRGPPYLGKGYTVVALCAGGREHYDPSEWTNETKRQLARFQALASNTPDKLRVKTYEGRTYVDLEAMIANESDDSIRKEQ